ncbi:MAG: nucleoside phosphorylase [Bacteroidota bacterium]|nr:nucleoside phosphorylase [Bacteroidota bacterium]
MIKESELILNPDGSIYHLKLKPEMLADTVLLVGDPGRVEMVASFFDTIEYQVQNRELFTTTGYFKGKRVSVVSTGMGTDNLDIVINELDALVNIDLEKREIKKEHKTLNLIRLGTSGALQKNIPVNSLVVSEYGVGLDGLMNYYVMKEGLVDESLSEAFIEQTQWPKNFAKPYFIKASEGLMDRLGKGLIKGVTATAPGFYGPQGRVLRLGLSFPEMNDRIEAFEKNGYKVTNFEMETSALYGLGQQLGHNTLTICAIIANRVTKEYSKDYKSIVKDMVETVLNRL